MLLVLLLACANPEQGDSDRVEQHREMVRSAASLSVTADTAVEGSWSVISRGPGVSELHLVGGLDALTGEPLGRAALFLAADGTVEGFRLSDLAEGSLPDALGFQNGDIVHDVNGLRVDTMGRGREALELMKASDELTFRVARGSQLLNLRVSLR